MLTLKIQMIMSSYSNVEQVWYAMAIKGNEHERKKFAIDFQIKRIDEYLQLS